MIQNSVCNMRKNIF